MYAKRLHLLMPFAIPAAANAAVLLRDLELSALEKLLQRASLVEREAGDAFQRTLPHERWLAREFGLLNRSASSSANPFGTAASLSGTDEAPLAAHMLLADGGTPGDATWACIEPVHIQIARDHLVLIDPDALALQPDEAARLLAEARPLVEELGLTLLAPNPLRWYISGTAMGDLLSASPLRASGRSVEIWLPQTTGTTPGTTSRRSTFWMKLQNEVQMAWFEHPVNEAREHSGRLAANSIWLHSQGSLAPLKQPFGAVFSNAPAARGLALASQAIGASLPGTLAEVLQAQNKALPATSAEALQHKSARPKAQDTALLQFDTLTMPFLHEDWYAWREALSALERDFLAPALAELKQGTLDALTLTLCGETSFVTLNITRADLRKFWRRRTFASILSE